MAISDAVSVGGDGGEAEGVGRPVLSRTGRGVRAEEVDDDDVVDARDRGGEGGSPPGANN